MRYVEENEINIYFLFIYVVRDFSDAELLTYWLWNFLYHNEEIAKQGYYTAVYFYYFPWIKLHISKRIKIYHHNSIIDNILTGFIKNISGNIWNISLKNMMKITTWSCPSFTVIIYCMYDIKTSNLRALINLSTQDTGQKITLLHSPSMPWQTRYFCFLI